MSGLFLDQNFKPEFKKIAMAVKLSDNPENWQREVASEIFKQLPYLADYAVNVILEKVEAQRGYALGSAEVTNITDSPVADQPPQQVRIPLIVKDRLLQPMDVMTVSGQVLALNERRLSEQLFRTDSFETSTRKPTDQGMVDQLYPPMRTNYGYGNSTSTGSGSGGFGKQASLVEAIAPTISENQFDSVMKKIASDDETQLLTLRNSTVTNLLEMVARHEPQSTEKTASALVASIKPTVVQLTKLASGHFMVKWANAGAFAPQQAQVDPQQAAQMAGGDVSKMSPGQTMTVTTEKAQKEALDEPSAKLISDFGDYAVKNSDTGETLVGTVIPVIDFEMHPLPLFVFTDGAGHYATQDEIVGIRQPGDGGMALMDGSEQSVAPQQDPAEGATPQGAPTPDAGMPKMALDKSDRYAVAGSLAGGLHGAVKGATSAPKGQALLGGLWGGAGGAAIGGVGGRLAHWAQHGSEKKANAQPQGDGVFVYMPQGGAKPFCTLPMTVKAMSQGPDGSQQVIAEDVFGTPLTLVMTPGMISFEQLDEEGTVAIPADMMWVALQGEAVHLAKSDTPDAHAEQQAQGGAVDVKSSGPGEVSMDGMPLAKIAREQKWFLKHAEAEFLLGAMGVSQDDARAILHKADEKGQVKLAGLKSIRPLAEVHQQAMVKAAALLKQYDYDFWTRDLIKEAAALEDSETADKILALNFLNPENLSTFASYLPELDSASSKLAEMLIAARLGMHQVPEGAAERSLKALEEVIAGLRALQTKQLI